MSDSTVRLIPLNGNNFGDSTNGSDRFLTWREEGATSDTEPECNAEWNRFLVIEPPIFQMLGVEEGDVTQWPDHPLYKEKVEVAALLKGSMEVILERISLGGIKNPQMRMTSRGSYVNQHQYTREGRQLGGSSGSSVDSLTASRILGDSGTFVVSNLEYECANVRAACIALGNAFNCLVSASAFYSSGKAPGFSPHYDTSHSLLVQVEGSKTWRCYPPVAQVSSPNHGWATVSRYSSKRIDTSAPAQFEVTLREGDRLWIPAGWVHEGTASEDASAHLTFGIQPIGASDILELVLADIDSDPSLREFVPPGSFTSPWIMTKLADWLVNIKESLEMQGSLGRRLQEYLLFSRLSSPAHPNIIGSVVDTDGGMRTDQIHGLRTLADSTQLHLGDRIVEITGSLQGEIEGWRRTAYVTWASLRKYGPGVFRDLSNAFAGIAVRVPQRVENK